MKKVYLDVRFTTIGEGEEERAVAILDKDCIPLKLSKGKILAYSNKGRYGLMTNLKAFINKYFSHIRGEIAFRCLVDKRLRIFTGEIRYAGRDLWGYDIELKGNESPYE